MIYWVIFPVAWEWAALFYQLHISFPALSDLFSSHRYCFNLNKGTLTLAWSYLQPIFIFFESIIITEKSRSTDMAKFYNHIIIAFADGLDDWGDDGEADIIWAWSRLAIVLFVFLFLFAGEGPEGSIAWFSFYLHSYAFYIKSHLLLWIEYN